MLTVRIDKDIKRKATAILQEKGMTVSLLVQSVLDSIVMTGDLPVVIKPDRPTRDEVSRRIKILKALELPVSIMMTDDEVREERLRDKHGTVA
ncbi:MAG: type II toxin-antitoxin system RelB/DinJ family antitoxin [Coriobacteriaceae bacterium]|jgi:addiction module RelB/DinJ family antitoxin|nr:type II toxin-antitoxin system RelB/DinJ family antitoxin [Coriobacteriaceae bacterium]